MRLIKLIAPAALLAGLALLPTHADAQTMGEYATTTAGVSSGGGSMGTNFAPPSFGSNDSGGGSSTWGASRLGASFDERAGAASQSSGGNFDSRAGSMTGGSTSQSRWPKTQLDSGAGQDRFGGNNDRFGSTKDRFGERKELSGSQDRFPHSAFSDNRQGLDTHFASGGLDNHYSIGGLDSGGTTSNP
jgi:hypothetical protein